MNETLEMEIKDQQGLRPKHNKKECCKCLANLRGNRGWIQGCGHLLCSGCTLEELQNGKNTCPACGTEVHYAKSQVMYFQTEDEEKEEAVEENNIEEYQEDEYDKQKTQEDESKTENTQEEEQFTIGEKEQFTDEVKEEVIEGHVEKETRDDEIKKENIEEKEQMTVNEEEQIKVLEKEECTEEEKDEAINVDLEQETKDDDIKNDNIEEKEQIMDDKKEQMIIEEEEQFTDEEKEKAIKEVVKEKTQENAIKKENIEEKEQIMDEGKKKNSVEDKTIKREKKEITAGLKKKSMETRANLNRIGLCQPLVPSPQLAEFLEINEGNKITTSECVKKIWSYIKKKKLQFYKDRYDEYGFVKPNKEMSTMFGNQPFKSMYIQKYIRKHLHESTAQER